MQHDAGKVLRQLLALRRIGFDHLDLAAGQAIFHQTRDDGAGHIAAADKGKLHDAFLEKDPVALARSGQAA